MKMNSLSAVLLIVLALAVGCGEQVAPNLHTAPARSTPQYTEAELNKLIVPGMTTAELTAKVGDPGSAVQVSTNLFMATYLFRFDPQNEGLAGFSVYIADGHVTKWSPITGDSHKTFVPGGSARSFGEQSFQLFLATDDLKNMVGTVNTEGKGSVNDYGHNQWLNIVLSADLTRRMEVAFIPLPLDKSKVRSTVFHEIHFCKVGFIDGDPHCSFIIHGVSVSWE